MVRKHRNRVEAGFTTIEAGIAMTVLAVALLALWGTLVYTSRSNLAAEQKLKAISAAEAKIEELKSQPFEKLIAEYGPMGVNGNEFTVPGMSEDSEAGTGKIVFCVDETAAFGDDGLPLDLNGDGDSTDKDVSATYEILPVMITVQWDGVLGAQSIEMRSILRKAD
ncbi:MAG: type IV pilus modification PilV family protein [Planctomycetota bacterium]